MIFYSPKGLTIRQWFKELRRRKGIVGGGRRDRHQKRKERHLALMKRQNHQPILPRVQKMFQRLLRRAPRAR